MSRSRTPRVFLNMVNYFIDSLKPKKFTGDYMGTDHFGNKYYEIPAAQSRSKRRPERWFKATTGESGFDNEKPAEWESWLRHRRQVPPTEEEIQQNVLIMEMKKKNAALLDQQYSKGDETKMLPKDLKGMDSYPKYPEYDYGGKKKSD